MIRTYTQLASVSPAKVAALVAGPSAEQITKQDWIGQARELALQQKSAKLRTNETVLPGDLHRVNFRVELVLTEDNDVHHTNVMHIQSRGKDNWASWQIKPLIDFFVQHAGLHLPPTELVFPVATTAAPAAPTESPPPVGQARNASDTSYLATGGGKTLKTTQVGSLFKQENGLLGLSERARD